MSLSTTRCVFRTIFSTKLAHSSINGFTFMVLQCHKFQMKCFQTKFDTVTRKTPMTLFSKRHVHITAVLKMSKNYYDVLGVDRNANQKQIKNAYYKLAMKYHPDKNQGKLTQQFREIKEAYDVLSNESSRIQYNNSFNNNDKTSTNYNWSSNSFYERYKKPPNEEFKQKNSRTKYQHSNRKYDYNYLRPYNVFIHVIKVPQDIIKINLNIWLMTLIKNKILKFILFQILQFIWSQLLNNINYNILVSPTTQSSLVEFLKNLLSNQTIRIELTEMESIRGKAIRVQVDENEKVLIVNIPGGVKQNQSFYLFYLINDNSNSNSSNKF